MKVQRNAPCPCGSGNKYKKCCGSSASDSPIHPGTSGNDAANSDTGNSHSNNSQSRNSQSSNNNVRPCGDCAACCQGWLTTHALGHDIYLGHPCPYTDGHGCTVHADRPKDPCKLFFCAWAEAGSELPQWMQPSQSGVIVISNRMSWKKAPVDILVSSGKDPDVRFLQWFQKRCVSNGKPFVYQQQSQWFGYGPQQFQLDLAAKVARGEALWDGALDTVTAL